MPELVLRLSPSEQRRVSELVAALRTAVEVRVAESSPLMSAEFVEEFQSRLLAQHVFLGNPLFQESFDTAFIASAEIAGFSVSKAPDGQRFWDVEIDGRKISLKSSRAKSLRKDTLHISKLTEAAWIQDCRTPAKRRQFTCKLFEIFCEEVDEIIQLRYFAATGNYEMVGIPVALFAPILELPSSEFRADGPTINIPVGQIPPDFTLKLDRSDAKITIANVLKSRCLVHGSWTLRT